MHASRSRPESVEAPDPAVTIRAGRASEIAQPDRIADLEELRGQLRFSGMTVDLEIAEYIPGRRGIAWIESVWIYIAGAASGALISNLVTDIHDQAKAWAIARFHRKPNSRPEAFTIYGPDGEVLKKFQVDDDGEHED
jgi:hypothetical protein